MKTPARLKAAAPAAADFKKSLREIVLGLLLFFTVWLLSEFTRCQVKNRTIIGTAYAHCRLAVKVNNRRLCAASEGSLRAS